jgi:hypothetical protein
MGASVTFIFFGILSLFGIIYTKIFVRDSSTLIEIFYENEIPIFFDQEKVDSNSAQVIVNIETVVVTVEPSGFVTVVATVPSGDLLTTGAGDLETRCVARGG